MQTGLVPIFADTDGVVFEDTEADLETIPIWHFCDNNKCVYIMDALQMDLQNSDWKRRLPLEFVCGEKVE